MKTVILAIVVMCITYSAHAASRPHHGHKIGHTIKTLPDHHRVVRAKRGSYYLVDGNYYRRKRGAYVAVSVPFGTRIDRLPAGFVSVGVGVNRYFYVGGTYYIKHKDGYEVTEAPSEVQEVVATADQNLIVYPAKAQSDEQAAKDRYECHVWSRDETQFDPSADNPDLSRKPDYHRAMSACLEARDYVVK
jgi:hypothetical protein